MTIKEIYQAFDKIGCLNFATINENGEPETRIAHLRAYDDSGIYFMTMFTKSFYKQLKATGKISLNGLCAKSEVTHDENGLPLFDNGYAIRLTGDVKEISMDEVKAKNNPLFDLCIKDQQQYAAMVVFCITSARGDIFDYDFEKKSKENKLDRTYFSYNGAKIEYKGLVIDQNKCISCGVCKKSFSFLAIDEKDGRYTISSNHCDECGDCFITCPVDAIHHHGGNR